MPRTTISGRVLAAALTLVAGGACRDATSPPPPPAAGLIPLPLSTLAVSTSTTGTDVDGDGYTVTVDGKSQHIASDGQVLFLLLPVGNHTVELSGIADNCAVNGDNPRTVASLLGLVGSTHFDVGCDAPPPPPETGSVIVTANTTGPNPDPDGYTVTLDGAVSQEIATGESATFSDVPAGDHTVELSGVAANCSVGAANPQTVTVPAGGTATADFPVTCTDGTGGGVVRITGLGKVVTDDGRSIGFDFDVASDLTGRSKAADSSEVRPDGTVGSVTVDPSADPETRFTAFRATSSTCSDPSLGVEFDGIGREDSGFLVEFTIVACDNGPAGSGLDVFRFVIPPNGYDRMGPVTSGDIVKSGP